MSQLRLANYPFRHSHDSLNKNPNPDTRPKSLVGVWSVKLEGSRHHDPSCTLQDAALQCTSFSASPLNTAHGRSQSSQRARPPHRRAAPMTFQISHIKTLSHESRSLIPMCDDVLMFSHRHARAPQTHYTYREAWHVLGRAVTRINRLSTVTTAVFLFYL